MPKRNSRSQKRFTVFQVNPREALYVPPEHNNGEEEEGISFFGETPKSDVTVSDRRERVLRPDYAFPDDVWDISPLQGSTRYRAVPDFRLHSEHTMWSKTGVEVISYTEMKHAPHGQDAMHLSFIRRLSTGDSLYNCVVHLGKVNRNLYNFEQMHLHFKFFHGVLMKVGSLTVHGTHNNCCGPQQTICALEVKELGDLAIISGNDDHLGSVVISFVLRIPTNVDLWNEAKWRDFVSVHKHFKLSQRGKRYNRCDILSIIGEE